VRDKLLIQALAQDTMQFMGSYAFIPDETLCVVARPFSGNVVALDTRSFRITHRSVLGGQPLIAVALSNGEIYSRDWKSGGLLKGRLETVS